MHDKGNLSRRGFMQRSLAALTVGAGLPAWFARELFFSMEARAADDKKAPDAPSEKLLMGAIGIGSPASRQLAIYGAAKDPNKHRNVEYIAACDVDKRHLDRGLAIMKKDGFDAKGYEDFRELLDNSAINAVTIAVPDHWHALIAIEAMRKKKDVYCEKPLTLTIEEGKAVVKVAKETGRVFQVGSQQRTEGAFRLACELVRNGRIGKVKQVETRIGGNPTCDPIPVVPVPEGLNWDFWLGPAPKADYVERKQGDKMVNCRTPYEFRWFYEYSGGKMTDWGAHHNDIAQWGLGMDGNGPIAVEAEGTEPSKDPNAYNTHPSFKITYTYASGAKLICANTQLDGSADPKGNGHDNGVLFLGEDGKWIFVNRSTIVASDKKLIDEPLPADAIRLQDTHGDHMGNFLEAVRKADPKLCICPAEVGHRSVTVCHIGNIALRSGKKLKWDPMKEQFDDADANKWLSREMRAPWKLEV